MKITAAYAKTTHLKIWQCFVTLRSICSNRRKLLKAASMLSNSKLAGKKTISSKSWLLAIKMRLPYCLELIVLERRDKVAQIKKECALSDKRAHL